MSDRILTLLVRASIGAGVAAAAALCFGLATAPASAAPARVYDGSPAWSAAQAIPGEALPSEAFSPDALAAQEDRIGVARPAGWDEGRGGWERRGWDRDRDEGRGWGHPHGGWGYPRYAEGWGHRRWGPPCRVEIERQWTGWGWTERPVRRCW